MEMREAQKYETITEVAVSEVDATSRLRPVSEAGVQSLIDSVRELGVLKDPIHVRKLKHKKGALVLIAGAHRLEMARRLGWEVIPATVWDCTDDWARMMEIDDNLSGAEMDALDLCVFLAERKRVYEKLHPETRRGMAGASARWGASDTMSFASNVAEKRAMSKRQIERLVSAGTALGRDEVSKLRAAPRPVQLADLMTIAKAGPVDRYDIVEALHSGAAKTAKAALKARAGAKPPRSDADEKLLRLRDAWDRAPAAARRQFVEMRRDEVAPLLAEGSPS